MVSKSPGRLASNIFLSHLRSALCIFNNFSRRTCTSHYRLPTPIKTPLTAPCISQSWGPPAANVRVWLRKFRVSLFKSSSNVSFLIRFSFTSYYNTASDGAFAKQIYDGANKASTFIIDYYCTLLSTMHENDGYCFKMAIAVGIKIRIFLVQLSKSKIINL